MHRINNEYIEKYLNKLAAYSGDDLMKEMEREASKMGFPILRKTAASFLDIMVKTSGTRTILEVGTSIGYSTLVLLKAMEKPGMVVTIEMDERVLEMARQNFKRAGLLDHITTFAGDAGEILHYMEGQYDMVFMDGPKAQYLHYFADCIRLLKPGGLLICDDVLFYGMIANDKLIHKRKITIVKRMRKFLQVITDHPSLDTIILPLGDGLSVSYKRKEV